MEAVDHSRKGMCRLAVRRWSIRIALTFLAVFGLLVGCGTGGPGTSQQPTQVVNGGQATVEPTAEPAAEPTIEVATASVETAEPPTAAPGSEPSPAASPGIEAGEPCAEEKDQEKQTFTCKGEEETNVTVTVPLAQTETIPTVRVEKLPWTLEQPAEGDIAKSEPARCVTSTAKDKELGCYVIKPVANLQITDSEHKILLTTFTKPIQFTVTFTLTDQDRKEIEASRQKTDNLELAYFDHKSERWVVFTAEEGFKLSMSQDRGTAFVEKFSSWDDRHMAMIVKAQ